MTAPSPSFRSVRSLQAINAFLLHRHKDPLQLHRSPSPKGKSTAPTVYFVLVVVTTHTKGRERKESLVTSGLILLSCRRTSPRRWAGFLFPRAEAPQRYSHSKPLHTIFDCSRVSLGVMPFEQSLKPSS